MGLSSQERLSTGVDALDDELGGGVPAGSLIAYTAPPSTQSILLLYELAAERDTVYVSTTRNDQLVDETLDAIGIDTGVVRTTYAPPGMAIEVASDEILAAEKRTNIIVDTADILETYDRHRYQEFLNQMLIHLRNIEGIALFHCHRDDNTPDNRGLTEAMAELVLELYVDHDGTDIDTYLGISKFRSGRALTEKIKVELTDRVIVDTSRNIA